MPQSLSSHTTVTVLVILFLMVHLGQSYGFSLLHNLLWLFQPANELLVMHFSTHFLEDTVFYFPRTLVSKLILCAGRTPRANLPPLKKQLWLREGSGVSKALS